MVRIFLGMILAAGLGGAALAQGTAVGSAEMKTDPNSSVVQPGIAKPPAGYTVYTVEKQLLGISSGLPNNPTLPQIALHPTATIGSPVPIAGAGGTTKSAVGQ